MKNFTNEDRYLRAKKRVDELKGFYWHLASYLVVNTFISTSKIVHNVSDGETFYEAFFDFGTFAVWTFWGIGILFHAVGVFGKHITLAKKWEERKLQQFLDEEKKQENKWL